MKSVFRMKTFAVYTVDLVCFVLIFDSRPTDAKTDTKCYGAILFCTLHKLSCNNDTVINITKADFGYRPWCNGPNGLFSCQNTDCCKEKNNDCFFSTLEEYQIVRSSCTGQQKCSVRGMRRYDTVNLVCNGRVVSAYSKIEYTCQSPVLKDNITTTTGTVSLPPLTPKSSSPPATPTYAVSATSFPPVSSSTVKPTITDITDHLTDSINTAIVGGVLGFLCIMLIITIILLVIYIKRRPPYSIPILDTHPQYDGLEFHSMKQNTNDGQSNYDMIGSNAAHINPSLSIEDNAKTKTDDLTYENIEQKKQKKKKVTKSTNNVSEQSSAPIYMNT